MAASKDLASIKEILRKAPAHKPPVASVLRGELRSDSGVDPEDGDPGTAKEVPCAPNIVIVWTYVIGLDQFDAFHDFLNAHEGDLAEEVANLGVGATYRGTYLELPQGNRHRTYWGYPSVRAIDKFKDGLQQSNKSDDLYTNVRTLISFIKDPALTMHREQRAGFHTSHVNKRRKSDPILELFAQAAGNTRSVKSGRRSRKKK
ncbi:MAG TPA: hypothetical protein VML91_17090 [Burkholderiales bacterium]|nr:hypothetical protein [Burkholderiales bacterium]